METVTITEWGLETRKVEGKKVRRGGEWGRVHEGVNVLVPWCSVATSSTQLASYSPLLLLLTLPSASWAPPLTPQAGLQHDTSLLHTRTHQLKSTATIEVFFYLIFQFSAVRTSQIAFCETPQKKHSCLYYYFPRTSEGDRDLGYVSYGSGVGRAEGSVWSAGQPRTPPGTTTLRPTSPSHVTNYFLHVMPRGRTICNIREGAPSIRTIIHLVYRVPNL